MVDLEVVGRHALLFDDDANAEFVDSEDALVEWNSLLIDRYDVRHLLSGPPPPRNRSHRRLIPPADASIAAELDRERFLDLNSSAEDEQEEDVDTHEERVIEPGAFRAVGFSYGNPEEAKETKNTDVETFYRPPFPVPQSLTNNLPPTEKVHQIIARTATFVSKNGGQSEIVLRVKQGDNPTFGFLLPDHHLHPYFRFLVDHQELLNSNGDRKQEKPGGVESDRTTGALSLLGSVYGYEEDDENDVGSEDLPTVKSNNPKENVDTMNSSVSEFLGSATVKIEASAGSNTKEKVVTVKSNPSFNSVRSAAMSVAKSDPNVLGSAGASANKTPTPGIIIPPVVEPPFELKSVIEKIVEFILRNGKEFEAVLAEQDRKYGRFPFLLQSNLYHPYYLQLLQNTKEGVSVTKGSVSDKERKSSSRPSEKYFLEKDLDKKEKSKMVLSKSKKVLDNQHHRQESPTKANQPPAELAIDAEAAAAILKAATRGIKEPGQTLTSTLAKPNLADASSLTEEQKLKAERLRRAREFAAMVKRNGATAPSKPDPPGPSKGSSAPEDNIDRSDKKNFSDEIDEKKSKRTYRSRRSCDDDDNDYDDDYRADRDHSRKKSRSHRSSHHSGDRHRRRHSSSKRDDERFSDDDDDHGRDRDRDHDRRSSRKRRKNRSSSDDEDHGRRSGARHDRGGSSSENRHIEVELEEGEIISSKSHRSKRSEIGQASSREASQPSDSTEVPDDLRAKIRAMLMATMQ